MKKYEVKIINIKGTWRDVADACNVTRGKESGEKEPSPEWKKRILLAEHSPIRKIVYTIKLSDIPSFVSVHLIRHKFGVEHYVRSQREDRTGIPRSEIPQDAPVDHEIEANLQALISISRKRLCSKADPKTREIWNSVCDEIYNKDQILDGVLVPECIYRGFCPEFKSCGLVYSKAWEEWRGDYLYLGMEEKTDDILREKARTLLKGKEDY